MNKYPIQLNRVDVLVVLRGDKVVIVAKLAYIRGLLLYELIVYFMFACVDGWPRTRR